MQLSLITATHNRPEKLARICLPSLLAQSSKDFEWVVVNDGADLSTREIVEQAASQLCIRYVETDHVGLCAARNLGLSSSTGNLVGFLDDDNAIYEPYVNQMLKYFESHPNISMGMPLQERRRDIYNNGNLIKQGQEFIGPKPNVTDLATGRGMFDSNGFIHKRCSSIRFNEKLLILSDFEYLLQCFSKFGLNSFLLCQLPLVRYIQTSDGIIGQSHWKDWLTEQEYLWKNRSNYKIFEVLDPSNWLPAEIEQTRSKVQQDERLSGF